MDYITLTSTTHVSTPVQQRPERGPQPTLGSPEVLDNGPPGTGAPPPDSKAAGPQKEVSANELKPQAKILDLLEEILPVDLFALLPQQGRPQLAEHSDTAALGIAMGDLKLNSGSLSVGDLLGALGVELPRDADVQDVGLIKKAVAEQIVEYGIPPNVRGLLASLLQSEDAFAGIGKTDSVPTINNAPATDADIAPSLFTTKPVAQEIASPSADGARPIPTDDRVMGDRMIGPPSSSDDRVVGDRMIGPPISSDDRVVGDRMIGPPISTSANPESIDTAGHRFGRTDRARVTRTIGTIELGQKGLEVSTDRLTRNLNRLEAKIVDALKFKQVVVEPAPTTGIDVAKLSEGLVRGMALKKAPLTQPVITTQMTVGEGKQASPVAASVLSDSVSKEVGAWIDIMPPANDAEGAAMNIEKKPVPTAKDGTALKFGDQDVVTEDAAPIGPRPTIQSGKVAQKPAYDPLTEVSIEDTSLEEALFNKEDSTVKQISDVKPTKTVAPAVSKVEIAMERVSEVHNRIIDHVQEIAAMRGNGKVTIRLQPHDLGTITVAVRSFGGHVDTKITASNENVRHALHIQRTDLVQTIESRGLSLNSFTVGQEAGSEAQGQGNAQSQGETMRQEFERVSNSWSTSSPTPTQAESPTQYLGRSDKAIDYLA